MNVTFRSYDTGCQDTILHAVVAKRWPQLIVDIGRGGWQQSRAA